MGNTVGVIIATYNGEKYVRHQLNTIINQSLKPDLIVVSDGGSTDNTIDICIQTLSNSGIQYKVLTSNERLSVQANFNKALSECNCNYIFFADQDDSWIRNKIEITINDMMKSNASLAFTNAAITNEALVRSGVSLWDSIGYRQNSPNHLYNQNDVHFIEELVKHNVVTGMTICITSKIRENALPLSNHALHDKWLSFLGIHFGSVLSINQELVLYRQHGNNEIGTDKSIRRSIKNSKNYVYNLQERIKMIQELVEKLDAYNIQSPFDYSYYLDYLKTRFKVIEQKKGRLKLIKAYKYYKKYELNPLKILLKDLIVQTSHINPPQKQRNIKNF